MATEVEERDFTAYADKVPTGTMQAFADWIIDEVFGGEFPGTQKDEKAFRNGVRLGGTLRMEFQASDYWRADERNPRSPAGKKARASANGSSKEQTVKRGRQAKADPELEDTEDEQEAPAKQPARRGRPAGSKTTTAAKGRGKAAAPKGRPASGTRRGRPAGSATADGGEAPY